MVYLLDSMNHSSKTIQNIGFSRICLVEGTCVRKESSFMLNVQLSWSGSSTFFRCISSCVCITAISTIRISNHISSHPTKLRLHNSKQNSFNLSFYFPALQQYFTITTLLITTVKQLKISTESHKFQSIKLKLKQRKIKVITILRN